MGVNLFYRFLRKQFCSVDSSSFNRLKRKKNEQTNNIWRETPVQLVGLKDFAYAIPRSAHLRDRSFIIAWGGGGRILGGITWFWGEKKGISRNWEPKRGDHWKLWKDSDGGLLKFAWKMKTWWGGGGKVTFIPPPAINDRSLISPFDTRHICVLRTF